VTLRVPTQGEKVDAAPPERQKCGNRIRKVVKKYFHIKKNPPRRIFCTDEEIIS